MLQHQTDVASLRDYFQILWRRKVTIITLGGLVPAAVLAVSLSQQPRYRTTAEVLLSQQNLPSGLTGAAVPLPLEDPDRFAVTQARLARTANVLRATLAATGVAESPAQLRAESSVSAAPDSDFLQFSVTNPSDRLAARLATEYARQFTLYRSRLDTAAIIRAGTDIAARLRQLERAGQRKSQLYSSLLTEWQQLTSLQLLQSPRAILADRPTGAVKVRPRPVRNTLVAAAFGVLLALGVAFLLEALDTRIHSAAELAGRLGLRLLGSTPSPPRRVALGKRLVMLDDPAGLKAEAFRMLRLNFDLSNREPRARLVMVTSALSEEGKSTTVANLAIACALAGRDVLLVDVDLRRPQLHEFFGVTARPGLTDVMLGRTELDEAIVPVLAGGNDPRWFAAGEQPIGRGGLAVLPAGRAPPDPGSFVEMSALTVLLAKLRSRYELVLFDTPPLLQVSDGIALSSRIDAVVIVARATKSRRPEARQLRHMLEAIPAFKLGLVITGAESSAGYGHYASGYRAPSAGEHSQPEVAPVPIERGAHMQVRSDA